MIMKCVLLVKECDLEPAGNCTDIEMHVFGGVLFCLYYNNKERPVTPTERRAQRARDILGTRIFKSGGEEVASTHKTNPKTKNNQQNFFLKSNAGI